MDDKIVHYGTPRKSGRYPWGSGKDSYQRSINFLGTIQELKDQGLTDNEIAKGFGMSTTEYRARRSLANDERRATELAEVRKLKEKGWSNVAIGEKLGKNESSIRAMLKPEYELRANKTKQTMDLLKDSIEENGAIDVGIGVERHIGVSRTKLNTAAKMLEDEGYKINYVKVEQLGTGKPTSIKVLTKEDVSYVDLAKNKHKIHTIGNIVKDSEGNSAFGLKPVTNVSSKKVKVEYDSDKDGLIELRRGVPEISLGNSKYAQVRIAVDGTHYLKGMAVYGDDIPQGKNIVYHSNKKKGTPVKDVFKKMKTKITGEIDDDNPFGSEVIQKTYIDKDGKQKTSALNIVYEEGDWDTWSRNLSSQMLSKQGTTLAKKQLELDYKIKKDEYDEIMKLTNPTVKRKLLESYAEGLDSDAVHLKAAALPRQSNKVLIPFPGMKDNEIYAPTYKNGENVVLIRHPHGGTFEIPEVRVNNKYSKAKNVLQNAKDAIGIHPKVAKQLSGADFDGDTVLVIPNPKGINIKTSAPLQGLKDFDPKIYKNDKIPKIKSATKQTEMGKISNLITDMTIKGADHNEIARAVRHSMVVIDAEKHGLDYKQSFKDNDIATLKKRYQGGENKGAATLISRAKSKKYVPHRVEGKWIKDPKTGKRKRVYVDPETGKKLYEETGDSYVNSKGKVVKRRTVSTKMYEADDAFKLMSGKDNIGTPIEAEYATYANKLKALANQSRKDALSTPKLKYSPSAKKTYAKEVESLNAKLNMALMNKPLERKAQLVANKIVSLKKQDNPSMDKDSLKKVKSQALTEARNRVGASKYKIDFTPKEWEAIQAGAITDTKLKKLLDNTPDENVKSKATPRTNKGMPASKRNMAKNMLDRGYTQAEVASHLGVSVNTINKEVNN
jgi:hypothetical protein